MNSTLTPEVDEQPHRSITVGRVLALIVIVALLGFWVYAFSPLAPDRKADGLADKSYVEAANARCRASFVELNALPRANVTGSRIERGAVVAQANAIVADLVAGLRADAVDATGRDRELLDNWLADWDDYLESRVEYADALLADEPAVFTVPSRPGGQITQTMDGFARINRITDCLVPLDV